MGSRTRSKSPASRSPARLQGRAAPLLPALLERARSASSRSSESGSDRRLSGHWENGWPEYLFWQGRSDGSSPERIGREQARREQTGEDRTTACGEDRTGSGEEEMGPGSEEIGGREGEGPGSEEIRGREGGKSAGKERGRRG
ncbi:hypothetical protein ACLOJK_040275 [Asimina triloba]